MFCACSLPVLVRSGPDFVFLCLYIYIYVCVCVCIKVGILHAAIDLVLVSSIAA